MAIPLRDRPLNRRTFLRGAGACVALPLLDAMLPIRARAAATAGPRKRLCLVFTPNGANMQHWTPKQDGEAWVPSGTLAPLAPLRSHVQVYSGFGLSGAAPHGDGPGDHARAAASFLTSAHPRKTAGTDLLAGVSVDQVAAPILSRGCDFPSLVLGAEPGRRAGNCDSGYSCAYSQHISWETPERPCSKESDPRRVFARLFGEPEAIADRARLQALAVRRRSVLDFALEDAQRLRRSLGPSDQGRLERYTESVREVERRLERFVGEDETPDSVRRFALDVPSTYPDQLALLYDLAALAFETDRTRVVTLMTANAGSNRSYPWLAVRDGHHEISHHEGNPEKQDKIQRIDQFQVEQFARFLGRLAQLEEDGRNVLDQSLVLFGSAIGDGNRHNHDDLPILLAGHGGGAVRGGAHWRVRVGTPLANLQLSMLQRLDVALPSFADSDGQVRTV